MLNLAKSVDSNLLRLVRVGREVNEHMPDHVLSLLQDGFKEASKKIQDSEILVLGISYKPDVKDIQITPAEPLIKKLKQLNAKVKIYDPYFKSIEIFGIKTENNMVDALDNTDAVMLITAHKEFHDLEPTFLASKLKTPIVVDSRGIIDNHAAKKAGLIFRGLGRGKI